jgi:chromosome condensin MukBEF MukE localization factor
MIEIKTREKIFYSKSGKPKSVLVDYKIYKEMLDLIEDNECIKIIEDRKDDGNISEDDFKKKIKME